MKKKKRKKNDINQIKSDYLIFAGKVLVFSLLLYFLAKFFIDLIVFAMDIIVVLAGLFLQLEMPYLFFGYAILIFVIVRLLDFLIVLIVSIIKKIINLKIDKEKRKWV